MLKNVRRFSMLGNNLEVAVRQIEADIKKIQSISEENGVKSKKKCCHLHMIRWNSESMLLSNN